jgi:hypothetical protein
VGPIAFGCARASKEARGLTSSRIAAGKEDFALHAHRRGDHCPGAFFVASSSSTRITIVLPLISIRCRQARSTWYVAVCSFG